MPYCSKCGKQLENDARFCPNCGTRTPLGVSSGVNYPAVEEIRKAFEKAGDEMERAFSEAAQELRKAVQSTSRSVRGTLVGDPIICKQCGEKNLPDARYCSKCGNKLQS